MIGILTEERGPLSDSHMQPSKDHGLGTEPGAAQDLEEQEGGGGGLAHTSIWEPVTCTTQSVAVCCSSVRTPMQGPWDYL